MIWWGDSLFWRYAPLNSHIVAIPADPFLRTPPSVLQSLAATQLESFGQEKGPAHAAPPLDPPHCLRVAPGQHTYLRSSMQSPLARPISGSSRAVAASNRREYEGGIRPRLHCSPPALAKVISPSVPKPIEWKLAGLLKALVQPEFRIPTCISSLCSLVTVSRRGKKEVIA